MKAILVASFCVAFCVAVTSCTPSSSGEGEGEGAAGEGEGAAGEGEGAAGEGEGEGGGAQCASASKLPAGGTGFVLSNASLAVDAANTAQCAAGTAYLLTFELEPSQGQGFDPFFDDNSVAVADNGTPAHDGAFGDCDGTVTESNSGALSCDGIQGCEMTCPLCYTAAPTDLAVLAQNQGGADVSAPLCVLP